MTVLFTDVVKAVCHACIVCSEHFAPIECVSFSQQVLNPAANAELPQGTYLTLIDWQVEQSKDPVIARVFLF